MKSNPYYSLLASTVVVLVCVSNTRGQAYCALRDPVRQIYDLYPQATSFRSIVKTVDEKARDEVTENLFFQLHFNELGRHTLYVALKRNVPVGLVHVRSEKGKWGMIEIAWAMDFDYRIVDFRFQRCRDPKRRAIDTDEFRTQIIGKNIEELQSMLTADGREIVPGSLLVTDPAKGLATSVLRSALKTIVVTKSVWKDDVRSLRMAALGLSAFPGGVSVTSIADIYSEPVLRALEDAVAIGSAIDRDATIVLCIQDKDNILLGMAVWTSWSIEPEHISMWWIVSPDLLIRDIIPENVPGDSLIVESFLSLKGRSLNDFRDCATAVELAGTEVLMICTVHLNEE